MKRTCVIYECNNVLKGHGLCNKHYVRLRMHGHTDETRRTPLREWFIEGDSATGTTACGEKIIVDTEDLPKVEEYNWCISGGGYAVRCINMKNVYFHKQIIETKEGEWADHINRNKLDNRKCNLRSCTPSQNAFNRTPSHKTSKYKGVSLSKKNNNWVAMIYKGKDVRYLGSFENEIDAAKAYNEAAKELFGEFAYLNSV